jgi:3-methyladenine DNA glycosylase AlkC
MPDRNGTHQTESVPALAEEDHVCPRCRLSYRDVDVEHAIAVIDSIPLAVRTAAEAVPPESRRMRPEENHWSVIEYVCHVRDVYATYTIRLHRARTEDRPVLEPMLNDLRARRFRYNHSDLEAVLDQLVATVAGFLDEVARTDRDQWARVVTRLPGEERTARWLVRQAMHEGVHHLDDIRLTGEMVAASIR